MATYIASVHPGLSDFDVSLPKNNALLLTKIDQTRKTAQVLVDFYEASLILNQDRMDISGTGHAQPINPNPRGYCEQLHTDVAEGYLRRVTCWTSNPPRRWTHGSDDSDPNRGWHVDDECKPQQPDH